ncbi:Na+/H+ antiporter subunit E [Marinimicrobium sp. ABcell2]|uniref:Na+/H+ antiporter subunit E n=1 Tax=Marinimicrobium sp. ABcell2 TaxID=3069751 RepID=UPI0027B200F8|nr:Na+/H+ antiporter subunit E [Marinimicrobium sp. ABcell2]MDQ2075365.1 Na+/H+ antiporter subunit E [Marinimicrobium sp. ABcell2]
MQSSTAKRRLLPQPLVSLVLVAVWLILNQSIEPGPILVALLLGWFLPWATQTFWLFPVKIRNWWLLVRYAFTVLWDITLSNIVIVPLLLGPTKKLQPAFFELPLDIDNPIAITVLANTVTLTPGTVSADIALDRSCLLIHGLHVPDIDAAIAHIKQRYEQPLREIF